MLTSIAQAARAEGRLVLVHGADALARTLAGRLSMETDVVSADAREVCAAPSARAAMTIANATALLNFRDPTAKHAVALTERLVAAIRALPLPDRPAAFLNRSSGDVFAGSCPGGPALGEHAPSTAEPAAGALLDVERAAAAAEELAVRVVLLRLPPLITAAVPADATTIVAGGPRWLNWISIGDAVGLTCRAIRGWDFDGPLHIVSPMAVPVDERHPLARDYRLWPAKALAASWIFAGSHVPAQERITAGASPG